MIDLTTQWTDLEVSAGQPRLLYQWEGYKKDNHRPHVALALRLLAPFQSLYEVGCGVGANLRLIKELDKKMRLGGQEVGPVTAAFAREHLGIPIDVGRLPKDLNLEPQSWDVLLSSYTLAYLTPDETRDALGRMAVAAKRALVIAEPQILPGQPEGMCGDPIFGYRHDYTALMAGAGQPFTLTWRWPVIPHVQGLNAISVYERTE